MLPIAMQLVAAAVPELISIFGTKKQAEVAEKVIDIAKQVTGKDDPDEAAKAIAADPNVAFQFKKAVLDQQVELKRIGLETTKAFLADVQDARRNRDERVFYVGVIVLITFALVMSFTLFGSYKLITGQVKIEPAALTAVVGLVGAIVGYVAANANQVIGFFFGSSEGSRNHGDALSDAVKRFGK